MKMLPSSKVALTFLGVFLIGALVGGLVQLNLTDLRFSRFLDRTGDPANMAHRLDQRLARDYHLEAEEQTRISPLTQAMAQHLYDLRRQFGMNVMATLDKYHQEIGAQMTPGQREAYQRLNEERRKRAQEMLLPEAAAPGADRK